MAGYKVEICGVNTSTLPLLKSKEKEELLKQIKAGDKDARDTFIKGNLRLVLSVVQRFTQSHENIDDLFQIGCIGMIKTWLSRTEHESPEAMAELTYHLIDNTTQEYIQNYIW